MAGPKLELKVFKEILKAKYLTLGELSSVGLAELLMEHSGELPQEEVEQLCRILTEKGDKEQEDKRLKRERNNEAARKYRAKKKAIRIAQEDARILKQELEAQLLRQTKDERKKARERKAQEELMKQMNPQQRWRYKEKLKKLEAKEQQLLRDRLHFKELHKLQLAKTKQHCGTACGGCKFFVNSYEAARKGLAGSFCLDEFKMVGALDDRCFKFKCAKSRSARARLKGCKECRFNVR